MRPLAIMLCCIGFLSACSSSEDGERVAQDMDSIHEHGLVVLTRNAPTTYFIDREEQEVGFEHDIVQDFAHYLGVEARFKTYDSIKEVQDALERGEGHLAAAGLTELESRTERFETGRSEGHTS